MATIILCAFLIFSSGFVLFDEEVEGKEIVQNDTNYIASAPFRINSDADFATSPKVSGGDGSVGNPWIIENYEIDGTGFGYCIYIGNTTDYFEVRGCYLHDASGYNGIPYFYNVGLYIQNSWNGYIKNNSAISCETGLRVGAGKNNEITSNELLMNDNGIRILSSWNNITNNNVTNSVDYGIYCDTAENNTISSNIIDNNYQGMRFYTSDNNVIINNTITDNSNSGIYMVGGAGESSFNRIYHNNFINNGQSYDPGNNYWNSSYPEGGNYWSDYAGNDLNSGINQDIPGPDGVGDTVYLNIVLSPNDDKYPLKNPLIDGRVQRPPIRINSNADFDQAHGVANWDTGNGTIWNPWIIEDFDINGTGEGYCIWIANTTDYFEIRNCYLHESNGGGGPYKLDAGLVLSNVSRGMIFNNNMSSNDLAGIYVRGGSNNNTINYNTVQSNEDGINLYASTDNYIENNTVSLNDNGIVMGKADGNFISNNTVFSNLIRGIWIDIANFNYLTNNTLSYNNGYGITLSEASYTTLTKNSMVNESIWISGYDLEYWNSHTIDITNTANGDPIFYWKNQAAGTTPVGCGQVILANCTNIVVENQNIYNTTAGIILGHSSGNTVRNSNVSGNVYGMHVYWSSDNSIYNIWAYSNLRDGMYFQIYSKNNTISNNRCGSNDNGISLWSSANANNVTNNYCSGNENYGILMLSVIHNNVTDNNFSNNGGGFYLNSVRNNTLENNTVNNNFYYGIWLNSNSHDNKVVNNSCINNRDGIALWGDNRRNEIINNTCANNNNNGIWLWGSTVGCNTIDNNTLYSNDASGIWIFNNENDTISNNKIYSNVDSGIFFEGSKNNTVENNNISDNPDTGIDMQSSNYNTIFNNAIQSNAQYGIFLRESQDNTISKSAISGSFLGIYLFSTDSQNKTSNNSVSDCEIYNNQHGIYIQSYSWFNSIFNTEIYENDFGIDFDNSIPANNTIFDNEIKNNTNTGVSLGDSSDNFVYHNNFINNPTQAFDIGSNFWDNGYPSGGNYWSDFDESGEGAYDEYSGVGQDIIGADGIVDMGAPVGGLNPYPNILGGAGAQDNYPLMEAMDPIDNAPPQSFVSVISPFWHNTSPLSIGATASDGESSIANVTLWYRYSGDNITWPPVWAHFELDTVPSWSWNFNLPDSEGYYEFYSIANDTANNTEVIPAIADASCAYDITAPASNVDIISPSATTELTLLIPFTKTDALSDVKNVTLWYSYSSDGITYGAWQKFGTESDEPIFPSFDFDFPTDNGYYQLYTRATDATGNWEFAPGSNDTWVYREYTDTTPPTSSVSTIPPYWHNIFPLIITATASDTESPIANVTLWYKYSSDNASWPASWTKFGLDETGPWSWNFDFPGGEGYYSFISIANDTLDNIELTGPPEASCGYDITAPDSSATATPSTTNQSTISITFTKNDALSGVKNVTLWYSYSSDGASYGAWVKFGIESLTPAFPAFVFDFPDGDGYYQFRTRSTDNASNWEPEHAVNDTWTCQKYLDTTPPVSSVNSISPYWHISTLIVINATANDVDGNITNVTLRYRYSADNSTWGVYKFFGLDTVSPWNWTFGFPDGEGYYQFYSIANDSANNTEYAPATADASCAYDIILPQITDNSPAASTTGDSYTFRAMVTDNMNLSAVRVIYWFGSGTETNATMAQTAADNYILEISIPSDSLDTLHYRIAAVDEAGNWNSPFMKDVIISDNDGPVADAGSDQIVTEGTIVTFDGSGSTDNIGIVNYTWLIMDGGGQIFLYVVSPSYNFTMAGNNSARLTVADTAGNTNTDTMSVTVQALPSDNDADGDGVPDDQDDFPNDVNETTDTDGDGTGDNADVFPDNADETLDTDNDGVGNNADLDDDGDGVPDTEDFAPLDPDITEDPSIQNDPGLGQYWWMILIFILVPVVLVVAYLMKKKKPPEVSQEQEEVLET